MSSKEELPFDGIIEFDNEFYFYKRDQKKPQQFWLWNKTGFRCQVTLSESEQFGHVVRRVQLTVQADGDFPKGPERQARLHRFANVFGIFTLPNESE